MENTNIPKLGGGLKVGGLNLGGMGGSNGGGLNFQLGNLEDLKADDNSPKAKPFSWVDEFEAIEEHMVQSREVVEEVDQHNCVAKIVTLEGEFFDLDCSVAKGIKVVATDKKEFLENVYESLEGLLMRASPLYIKAFTSSERSD